MAAPAFKISPSPIPSKQLKLLAFLRCAKQPHIRRHSVLLTLLMQQPLQLLRLRRGARIAVAVALLILSPQPGEQVIQLRIVILALPGAQTHPDPGDDELRPCLGGALHNRPNILRRILDQRQHRHHQQEY